MQSAHGHFRPRGLPRWTLWAATPVVLAMGFVTGMAIATYSAGHVTAPAQQTEVIAPPVVDPQGTAPPSATQADTSWSILSLTGSPAAGKPDGVAAQNGAQPGAATAAPVKFTGTPVYLIDARKALVSDFSTFAAGGVTFQVEYQAIRQAASSGTSLVGMLRVADYPAWEKAVLEQPAALKEWLEKAAGRVLEASHRQGFHVAWGVVESVDVRPAGFADQEITPMEDGSFLVVRRLAATLDPDKTEISLRSLPSLQESAANKQVRSTDPWATYGPVIRFDGEDIYRPLRTLGLRPKR